MQLKRHRGELARRMQLLHRGGLVLLGIIAFGYWQVQVIDGSIYRERADHNRLRKLAIEAPRGLILDRHGTPLVENVPSYRLELDRTRVSDLGASLRLAARLLGETEEALRDQVEAQRRVPLFRPIPIAEDLSLTQVSRFAVVQLEHPEFEVRISQHRLYRYAHQTAHLLGYLGEVNEDELRDSSYLRSGDLIGRKGLERVYESRLRGTRGEQVVVVDSRGQVIEEYDREPSSAGTGLNLTLDLELQQEASRLLQDRVGTLVALDPRSGAVLAMASSPSFDPNLFSRGIAVDDWRNLIENPKDPLQNRVVQNTYPPGSVFKLVMAAAALATGKVDPSESFFCGGYSVIYDHRYRCWKRGGHGRVDLRGAIEGSCNVYFHQMGVRLGIDEIARHARLFGLGRKTGIDLSGERGGLVPDSRWSQERRGTPWYAGETISVATGQGPLLVTPLQIATMTAVFANRGLWVQPHLSTAARIAAPQRLDIAPAILDQIRDGMWAVVNEKEGTGRAVHLEGVEVAGKTGTAQVVQQATWTKNDDLAPDQRDHAWFASFAPYDDPQLVVVVFVEHGGGGSSVAAPLAKPIYEKYFEADLEDHPPG
ncbi:MAG: penicillin-binding protein 2 [Thermoanaerobaculia bacterium]|nr:penicillin-binding protein 2 [Thermoanaerobaculia bacterium]